MVNLLLRSSSLFLAMLALTGLWACNGEQATREAASGRQGAVKDLQKDKKVSETEEPAPVKKEAVDPQTLQVYNVRVGTLRRGLNLVEELSFEPDGRTDYISYRICPLEDTGRSCPASTPRELCARGGECSPGVTAYNRVRLPMLYQGKISIEVASCIDPAVTPSTLGKDASELCGPHAKIDYNSKRYDPQLAEVLNRAYQLRQETRRLIEKDYRDALAKFVVEADKCDNLNADVKKVLDSKARIIEQFIRAPIAWFGQAGEDLIDKAFGSGSSGQLLGAVDDFSSQISKALGRLCQAIGNASDDKVCSAIQTVIVIAGGFIEALSPVSAFATASNTIHDIAYGTFLGQGDKLVPKGCHAEANLQRSVTAIQRQIEVHMFTAKDLKGKLDAAGMSLPPSHTTDENAPTGGSATNSSSASGTGTSGE